MLLWGLAWRPVQTAQNSDTFSTNLFWAGKIPPWQPQIRGRLLTVSRRLASSNNIRTTAEVFLIPTFGTFTKLHKSFVTSGLCTAVRALQCPSRIAMLVPHCIRRAIFPRLAISSRQVFDSSQWHSTEFQHSPGIGSPSLSPG